MDFLYQAKHALAAIDGARHILLVSHRKPDGDTLGAATAMMQVLDARKKSYTAFCEDAPGPIWSFLPKIESFITTVDRAPHSAIDLVIFFDASDIPYSGFDRHLGVFAKRPMLLQFDHHRTNLYFADVNVVLPEAASTTEVLWRFFEACNIAIDRNIATCLLTGAVTDTTAFTNPATTASSLQCAAACLLRGARFPEVLRETMRNKERADLQLWGRMLARLTKSGTVDCAVTVVTRRDVEEFGSDEESLEGIANFLNNLGETKAVLIVKELDGGKIKGSFRTTRSDVDVGKLALAFGGGGHRKAAGFTIEGKLVETEEGWKIE
ncbi:bifunctional oligoribonuclease/PAP phosphatase NrnA [Candidatus Uhrbacteria bacterium]|nr:bifunctional oligoribonuclease/PAP phosphatase NrnA [Candidatus Uhrbacteria bacterium]